MAVLILEFLQLNDAIGLGDLVLPSCSLPPMAILNDAARPNANDCWRPAGLLAEGGLPR